MQELSLILEKMNGTLENVLSLLKRSDSKTVINEISNEYVSDINEYLAILSKTFTESNPEQLSNMQETSKICCNRIQQCSIRSKERIQRYTGPYKAAFEYFDHQITFSTEVFVVYASPIKSKSFLQAYIEFDKAVTDSIRNLASQLKKELW